MTAVLTVSPDFSHDHIAGWYVFNTWLQRRLDMRVHLELFYDFPSQREAIDRGAVDLIYANPFDAATLVRERGFTAIAAPAAKPDEAVVAVSNGSPVAHVEDLRAGTRIAVTIDPDVNLIGMIMLEPADLNRENTTTLHVDNYVIVAKKLLRGEADVGFFLKEAYDDLSQVIKRELRVLVTSQISVIRHVFLVSPRLTEHRDRITEALVGMSAGGERDRGVLEALGVRGWEAIGAEDTEFMIDLMDTLTD